MNLYDCPIAHRLARLLQDEPDHRCRKWIKSVESTIDYDEWSQDPTIIDSFVTILLNLCLEKAIFGWTGLRDALATCLFHSSKNSLRHLEFDLEISSLEILNMAPKFNRLSNFELGYRGTGSLPVPTNDFLGLTPLHIPTVKSFGFYWFDMDHAPQIGLITFIGACVFNPSCKFDIYVPYVPLSEEVKAAVEPLFVAHQSRKIIIEFPLIPASSILTTSNHVVFQRIIPDRQLFESGNLPERITFTEFTSIPHARNDPLFAVLETLMLRAGSFHTIFHIATLPHPHYDGCRWRFTEEYTDQVFLALIGKIIYYTARLAPKGIIIVDSDGMTLQSKQEGPMITSPYSFAQ